MKVGKVSIEKQIENLEKISRLLSIAKKYQIHMFLAIGVLSIIIAGIKSTAPTPSLSSFFLSYYGLIWLMLATLGFLLIVGHDYTLQRRADCYAQLIRLRIQNSHDSKIVSIPSFCLYLRPFLSTGKLALSKNHFRPWLAFGGAGGPQNLRGRDKGLEFEVWIEKLLGDSCHLVALGQPFEQLGAGRLEVDDSEWKKMAFELMVHAKVIILVPWYSEGTNWEIDSILSDQHLVSKTTFIFPPEKYMKAKSAVKFRAEFERIWEIFSKHNKSIPRPGQNGSWFYFTETSDVEESGKCEFGQLQNHLRNANYNDS